MLGLGLEIRLRVRVRVRFGCRLGPKCNLKVLHLE